MRAPGSRPIEGGTGVAVLPPSAIYPQWRGAWMLGVPLLATGVSLNSTSPWAFSSWMMRQTSAPTITTSWRKELTWH